MKRAYGGVVINASGQVLLRQPTDHYHGYAWTFAKGKPLPGESPSETALREVFEETGVRAKILLKLPDSFDGSRTSNEYFLMAPIEETGRFDSETEAVRWAAREEAAQLILQTLKPRRRRRDLRVLKIAYALLESIGTVSRLADDQHPQS
jgi:8-oxo-dGTP pyrophosphatase MutT (NUDIX family)